MTAPNGPKRPLTRRRALALAGATLGAAAIAGRIAWVNAQPYRPPQEIRHPMGEWVDLDGAFIEFEGQELTAGYSVRVRGAEVLSYNEFVATYSVCGPFEPIEGADVPAILSLAMDVHNKGNAKGTLVYNYMFLVPARRNTRLQPDPYLFSSTETALEKYTMPYAGPPLMDFTIRPDSEYSIHIPYVHLGGAFERDGKLVEEEYFVPIEDTCFDLVLSNLPVRHVIEVEVNGVR